MRAQYVSPEEVVRKLAEVLHRYGVKEQDAMQVGEEMQRNGPDEALHLLRRLGWAVIASRVKGETYVRLGKRNSIREECSRE